VPTTRLCPVPSIPDNAGVRVQTLVGADSGDQGQPAGADRTAVAGRRGGNPYLEILRIPGALAFSATAFVGRMSMSMYGLGTVLLIASLTGRYGLAGTVSAAGAVGYAVVSPLFGRLADRWGQGRVLSRQATAFALGSATFIGCAELRAPAWVLLVTATVAGAVMPSVGSMVRTRWSAVLDDEHANLHTAFSLESVNDELIFVIGPALVTFLATRFLPASGVGAASLFCVGGTLAFAAQRRTEPALSAPSAPRSRPKPGTRRRLARLSLPAPGLITLAPAFLLLGAMFAAMDLSTVALATERGHRAASGLVLGAFALGSAAGGLWYGSRHWRAPLGRRFIITSVLAVAGISTFWAMPGLLALAAIGFLAATSVAPTLIAGYGILEGQAPDHRRTEAMAWLSSTIAVGVALGSAVVGRVIDAYGARWGLGLAAAFGCTAIVTCLAGYRALKVPGPAQPGTISR
jgi:MFS family permease